MCMGIAINVHMQVSRQVYRIHDFFYFPYLQFSAFRNDMHTDRVDLPDREGSWCPNEP